MLDVDTLALNGDKAEPPGDRVSQDGRQPPSQQRLSTPQAMSREASCDSAGDPTVEPSSLSDLSLDQSGKTPAGAARAQSLAARGVSRHTLRRIAVSCGIEDTWKRVCWF